MSTTGPHPDVDPTRFTVQFSMRRAFRQAYVRENAGGVPLVLVHGWPESKRIFWKVVEPLAAAGFEVIVPDLRGFGESEPGPDGFHDVPSHVRDVYALVHDELGHDSVVLAAGDLGGPVIQDAALRYPGWVDRMVLFNSPLPYDKERMAGIQGTRAPAEAADYFIRQGTDADALAGELATPEQRRRYISTFYTSRFWAHPGSFSPAEVDFHIAPFADAARLRASFGAYESTFSAAARSEPSVMGSQRCHADDDPVRTERSRAVPGVRPDGGRGVRAPHRPVPAARLRTLRALGAAACVRLSGCVVLRRSSSLTVCR